MAAPFVEPRAPRDARGFRQWLFVRLAAVWLVVVCLEVAVNDVIERNDYDWICSVRVDSHIPNGETGLIVLASWLAGRIVAFGSPFREPEFTLLDSHGCDLDRKPVHSGNPYFYLNRSAVPRALPASLFSSFSC